MGFIYGGIDRQTAQALNLNEISASSGGRALVSFAIDAMEATRFAAMPLLRAPSSSDSFVRDIPGISSHVDPARPANYEALSQLGQAIFELYRQAR
ncbi:hypothetical protein GOP47_0021358 [Adiantum capillus-veneris]|uniref:Uncharacterized protein n=1 Tax=Adiantum capillus-veneris TaxID=13818 RepID=A0A9D4U791_ADICA|nr:hypothetical protein GOP47_0021358 [Adiantum capillus-veneris]